MPRIIVKDHKYYFKIRGLGGPKGDKGDTGPAGPQGPQGPYVNVVAGTTTTLPAGSSAQVTVNNTGSTSVLNFGIPQGSKGDKGDAGTPGAQGPRGFAATVNVGETTTGQPGTNASVVNAGNEHDAVLKFTIPKGEKGETGETGPQGPTGSVKSTVVTELPETGESDKYYLVYRDSEGGTITTTDGYAHIENGENAGDLTASQLLGNAEQTTYSGKNLLYATELPKTQSNVTATYQDGIFGLSGTSSTATNLYILPYTQSTVHLEAGESITMYIERVSGTSKVYFTGYFEPDDGSTVDYDWGITLKSGANTIKRVKTASKAGNMTHVQMFIDANTTYNLTAKILVQKGDIANPTWEPYVGGTASPNPDYPQPISTVTGGQTVRVTGKNFFDVGTSFDSWFATDLDGSRIISGDIRTKITGSISDGKIKIDTYDNSGGYWWMSKLISLPKNTTLTAMTADGTHMMLKVIGFTSLATGATGDVLVSWQTINHTAQTFDTGNYPYYVVSIYPSSASNNNSGVVDRLQLEEGSTATAYEPYQGQSYEINLGLAGKNMLNPAWMTAGFISGSGTITPNQAQAELACQDFIPVEPNTEYTFEIFATSDTYPTWIGIGQYSAASESNFVTRSVETNASENYFSFTTASNTHFIRPSARNLQHATKYMLSKGSRTTYEPYFELAKVGNYQDRIYKNDGKWYIRRAIGKTTVSLGSIVDVGTLKGGVFVPSNKIAGYNVGAFCTNATYILGSETKRNGVFYENSPNFVFVGAANDTLATLKTKYDGAAFYYVLNTPTTTEITNETLLAQLNFLASLYGGENNISIIGTGAQGEFTGDYVVYDKYDRHKVYIWSSDDNTWQIIVQ